MIDFQGAAAAINPSAGALAHVAAEMNRDLEEIRRKNLRKPPTAVRKPVVASQVDEQYRSAYDQKVILAQKEKEVKIN